MSFATRHVVACCLLLSSTTAMRAELESNQKWWFLWRDTCTDAPKSLDELPGGSEHKMFEAVEGMPCLSDEAVARVQEDVVLANMIKGTAIPHIHHQSWKTHEVSEENRISHESFAAAHPDWEYRLWDDAENQELMSGDREHLRQTYQAFAKEIYRADMIRPMYMWKHGGVYSDLDYKFYQSLEPALRGHGVVLGSMQVPEAKECWITKHALPNAFMSSVPGHPFWRVYLELIHQHSSKHYDPKQWEKVVRENSPEYFTGPVMMLRALKCYREVEHLFPDAGDVYVAPPRAFYPYSWGTRWLSPSKDELQQLEAKLDNQTYAATWWGHSW